MVGFWDILKVEPTGFPKGLGGGVSLVSIGIRDDSESSDLSNWKDGIAINHDRFAPTTLPQEARADLC